MARIRTIKPEFWTDEKIVRLPYEARLLFIGLWNFSDDEGYLVDEPDRIRMQVFPGDNVDCDDLIDLLCAAELIERLDQDAHRTVLRIPNFARHQKVSHATPSKLSAPSERKRPIGAEARRELARKYRCPPGGTVTAECYYCKSPGTISWHALSSGRPGSWVSFGGLEIDHFTPENSGGSGGVENLILSCRYCNRSKGVEGGFDFLSRRLQNSPENSGGLPPEGKGRERKGVDGAPEDSGAAPAKRAHKTAVLLPQTWTLTDDWRAAATKVRIDSKLPPCNLDLEADAFLRYWTEGKGAGTKRPDWRSTWLNWVRKATSKPLEALNGNGRPWEGYAPGAPKPAGIAIGSIEDIDEREEMGLLTHAEAEAERAKARARMAAR